MKKMSRDSLEEIVFFLDHQFIEDDTILFRAGDYVDKLFFVASGEIEILVSLEEADISMEICKEGCAIGLHGIVTNRFHHLTAKTKSKASLYILRKDVLKHLINQREDIYNEIEKAKKFYKETNMPIIDFSLPKIGFNKEKTPIITKIQIGAKYLALLISFRGLG